jgi:RHS repeat-associated protein
MEVKDDDLATKFIYVGESRVISKLSHIHDLNGGEYERINTYYHHTDHLGTSNVITDYQGAIYKEIYLTAYGEEFVNRGDTLKKITADFTGKPYDSETKMHYFGARYYDSKTSRWVSPDPAYGEYLNSDKGMGGIYNPVNSQVYHYAGNNPLKYVDPDGNELKLWHYIHIASAVYSTVNFVAGFFGNKQKSNQTTTTTTTTIKEYPSGTWSVTSRFGNSWDITSDTVPKISKDYYPETDGKHYGIDQKFIKTKDGSKNDTVGAPVYSMIDGEVIVAEFESKGGNIIRIQSGDYVISYMHLDKILVKVGDKIKIGQLLAEAGKTGSASTGAHLHTDQYSETKPIDLTGDQIIERKKDNKTYRYYVEPEKQ